MRLGKKRGSYFPVLSKLVSMTTGPILELGAGFCSTPYLHWGCYPDKRKLVSYEGNPEYYRFAESWEDDFHEIKCVNDWDSIDISQPWEIAFVDHSPAKRRGIEAAKLFHADYIVVHDSENSNAKHYGINRIYRQFKYRYKYTDAYPFTSIWSNKHDIRDFKI